MEPSICCPYAPADGSPPSPSCGVRLGRVTDSIWCCAMSTEGLKPGCRAAGIGGWTPTAPHCGEPLSCAIASGAWGRAECPLMLEMGPRPKSGRMPADALMGNGSPAPSTSASICCMLCSALRRSASSRRFWRLRSSLRCCARRCLAFLSSSLFSSCSRFTSNSHSSFSRLSRSFSSTSCASSSTREAPSQASRSPMCRSVGPSGGGCTRLPPLKRARSPSPASLTNSGGLASPECSRHTARSSARSRIARGPATQPSSPCSSHSCRQICSGSASKLCTSHMIWSRTTTLPMRQSRSSTSRRSGCFTARCRAAASSFPHARA
mmetsp:Transcript_35068/g.98886  ORF Transcript_35068/g.98886 Transcript_35068/m.98886 type:complete len:322 (-) Transcript_35068:198-1163(-)